MNYQKYIDLGFERTDINDSVEFKQTGYYGFFLEKKINKKMSVSVYYGELDKPKLYIKKRNSETYNIIQITPDCVIDIFTKKDKFNPLSYC